MVLMSGLGALSFVLGVTLLALDAARSLTLGRFEATSLQTFWVNFDLEAVFPLRHNFSQWFGAAADPILELPVAFIACGIGVAFLIIFDGAQRDRTN
jgi:hypothetical protein